jgi:carboxymethylenebutenolidase
MIRCWPVLCTVALFTPDASGDGQAVVKREFVEARPPDGAETLPVRWITVATPDRHMMLAAVARPDGAGPFPAVVVLHGSHGFARQYVQLAQDLSKGGVIGVAACWFSGGVGAGRRFVAPISCPDAPPMPRASDASALQSVDALVQAVRTLPDVRGDRIALFGHSRGGGAALNYALTTNRLQALALNSTGYPADLLGRAHELKTPILILHGTADSAADGGSPVTDVQMARNFEAALRRAGASVEANYYPGGEHNGIFAYPKQYEDQTERMKSFFAQHLRH